MRYDVLVLSCGQTDRQTDQRRDAGDRYTHATPVGVTNYVTHPPTCTLQLRSNEVKFEKLKLVRP